MTPFLAAQANDPFNPASMLIQADWLEEEGDIVGAGVLRGLAEAGYASPIMLALGACADSILAPDDGISVPITGRAEDEGGSGSGDGFLKRINLACGNGWGDRFGYHSAPDNVDGNGEGKGDQAGFKADPYPRRRENGLPPSGALVRCGEGIDRRLADLRSRALGGGKASRAR